MPSDVKIVAGAGDNAAGAISLGITQAKRAMLSLGTSGVYFAATAQFQPHVERGLHAFCHCIPNTWHQMGVILSAASCLQWWSAITKLPEAVLIEQLEESELKQIPLFLPYLSGERTPHIDSLAKGCFIGMTHTTQQQELTQAVLEGVGFAIADCQQVLKEAGTDVHTISVIGGGAKSRYWGDILASMLNKPLHYHSESLEGPALGAAKLACYADGKMSLENLSHAPETTHEALPQADKFNYYQGRWHCYQKAYAQLKPLFKDPTL